MSISTSKEYTKGSTDTPQVWFSREQAAYLEKQFPEAVLPSSTPEARLREYFGTRLVVSFVKSKSK